MHIDPEQRQGLAEQRPVEEEQSVARHLRSLPHEIRQPYDWIEFRSRARVRVSTGASGNDRNKQYLAIAAVLLLVIAGMAGWIRVTRSIAPDSIESGVSDAARVGPSTEAVPDDVDSRVDVAERWLASLPGEPVVVRVGTRAAVAGLEDRIAQLDDLLSAARVEGTQPARLAALEQQRVRLVNSLVQVRYAETLVSESY
jgi:hypothetical protein